MFEKFVQTAMAQDDRNYFAEYKVNGGYTLCVTFFYQKYNPEDVEMVYGTDVIWFVPAQKLLRVKKEYSYLDADIIIANINGDSVFMKGPIVYTCPRGTGRLKIEKGADSFEAFIEAISLSE